MFKNPSCDNNIITVISTTLHLFRSSHSHSITAPITSYNIQYRNLRSNIEIFISNILYNIIWKHFHSWCSEVCTYFFAVLQKFVPLTQYQPIHTKRTLLKSIHRSSIREWFSHISINNSDVIPLFQTIKCI